MKKSKTNSRIINWLIPAGLFFMVAGIYIYNLCPSIYPGDNPDVITAAATLGIPHPPGYPLFTFLGYLFTKIPLGTIPWRVNLMSAIFSALSIMMVYLILFKITKKILPSLFGATILAFSYRYFQESLYADYLSLSNLLVTLEIFMLILWRESKKIKYYFLFAFLFGLSFSHHQVSVILLPAYLYFIYVTDIQVFAKWKILLQSFGFFALGLIPYLYLYFRGLAHPVYIWSDTTTLQGLWNYISRKDYSGNDFSNIGYFYKRIWDFLTNLGWRQFTIFGTLLGLIGLLSYKNQQKNTYIFLLLLFLCGGILFAFLSNTPPDVLNMITLRRFYIIGILFFSFFIGLGTDILFSKSKIFLILFLLPLGLLIYNFPKVNLKNYYYAYDIADNILKSIPENTILYSGDDTPTFELWFLQYVEKKRPDVIIIPAGDKDIIKSLAWKNIKIPDYSNLSLNDLAKKYPIYSAFASDFFWGKKIQYLIPEGLVYRYTQDKDWISKYDSKTAEDNFKKYIMRGKFNISQVNDDQTRNILTNYANAYINVGIILQSNKKSEEARKYYEEGLKINPYSEVALINLAGTYYDTGNYQKAREEYLKLFKKFPNSAQVRKGYDLTEEKLSTQ